LRRVTGEECKAVSACTHAMYMLEKDACESKGQKIKTAVRYDEQKCWIKIGTAVRRTVFLEYLIS